MNMSEEPEQQTSSKRKERPRKWSKQEITSVHRCIMKYGHKNFEKLQEYVPGRSIENIRTFLRTAYDTGTRRAPKNTNYDGWIELCLTLNVTESAWKDCLQVAQAIKFLSVDGLIENHPLPEASENINFSDAYRYIYQALMGYPLQPIGPETAKFIHETIAELNNEAKNETAAIEALKAWIKEKLAPEEIRVKKETSKPVRVYTRKRKSNLKEEESQTPSLKIMVEPSNNKNLTSSFVQDFSVTIQGSQNQNQTTIVNVPVPLTVTKPKQSEEEEKLLKSKSYNPFSIPENWLNEPVYLNMIQKYNLF